MTGFSMVYHAMLQTNASQCPPHSEPKAKEHWQHWLHFLKRARKCSIRAALIDHGMQLNGQWPAIACCTSTCIGPTLAQPRYPLRGSALVLNKNRGVERSADPHIHRTSIDLLLRLGTEGSKQPALNSVSSCAWLNLWRKLWKAEKLSVPEGVWRISVWPKRTGMQKAPVPSASLASQQCFCDCMSLWEIVRFRQSRTQYHPCTTYNLHNLLHSIQSRCCCLLPCGCSGG